MGIVGTGTQVQSWDEEASKASEGKNINSLSQEGWSEFWFCFRCCPCFPENPSKHSISTKRNSATSESSTTCIVPPGVPSIESDISAQSDLSVLSKTEEELMLASELRRFTFSDLKLATRNFRPDSLLGEGGFGYVFKGWIDEHGTAPVKPGTGLIVAVKTLNHNGLQGHREWLTEVTYLGQLHHPNLVKLIGFCMEDDQRLLVYEFMKRGSLENHLFRKGALLLPWNTRMKIALGAAKGVEFLHSRKKPVIYRDFKTSNILLDSDYSVKLSDFGLAKDGPQGDKSHVSTRVMGTYGYAAPEYLMTGHLSSKSDVYSFGVVLLEMITGKRSMDKSRPHGEHNLAEWARPFLNDRRKFLRIVDPRLEGRYSIKGAQKAGYVAYRCLNKDPRARLSMSVVVECLERLQNLSDMANAVYPTQTGSKDATSMTANGAFYQSRKHARGLAGSGV